MNEKVKQALENVKNIKVGSMVLNDLFGEDLKVIETTLNDYEEEKKELIAEQHRLFDLAKEQEEELKELREFAKLVNEKSVDMLILKQANKNIDYEASVFMPYSLNRKLTQAEFDLVKKVVKKYGER